MRRRSRSRGGGGRGRRLAVLLVAVGVVLSTGNPAVSFTVASADRATSIEVVGDESGIMTLDIKGNLTAGSDQRLVDATNYVGRGVNVTVTLQNASYGDLEDDDETDDSVTFHLDSGATQRVNVSLNCEPGVGETIAFRIQADDVGFEGDLNRTAEVSARDCVDRHVVWTDEGDSSLRSRSVSGTVYDYNTTASVLGQHSADLDADGVAEIAYVEGATNELRLIDRNNETSGVLTSDVWDTPTHLWVGAWNGSGTAVFYVNSSDRDLYYVTPGSDPVEAVDGVKAGAVAGAGDVDGDGSAELVYTGGSQTVKYAEPDGTTGTTGVGVGKNNGIGVGEPADFDADGKDRVPIVDGSNQVFLIDAAGNKKEIVDSGAEKTFLAPFDWDTSDSQPEVTFVDASDHEIEYVEDVPTSALLSGATSVKQTGRYADPGAGTA